MYDRLHGLGGTTDTESFRAYVEACWCHPAVGDLVVMDNLSPHKSDPTWR